MGRQQLGEYVDRKEAARLLGVTTRALSKWTQQGLISPQFIDDRKKLQYRRSDVQMLRLAREDKNTDVWQVKALALQALATARASETRLLGLLEHLGFDAPPLDRSTSSIQALYEETLTAPTVTQLQSPEWWRFWAGVFFALDEVYLELVEKACYDDEPWKRYMDFASDTARAAKDERAVPELRAAQRYFHAGARHLWYIGYMFCRRMRGRRVADIVFDGSHSAVDELMAVLH